MAGGQRGDEFNSQMNSVEELLKNVPKPPGDESADDRQARKTREDFNVLLGRALDRQLSEQRRTSREMADTLSRIQADENGRSAANSLRAICENVEKMRESSHVNESVLFAMQELRDINYEIRNELQAIASELRTMNGQLERLTILLSNGHAHH